MSKNIARKKRGGGEVTLTRITYRIEKKNRIEKNIASNVTDLDNFHTHRAISHPVDWNEK